jgi:methyl-accepting chemotaxis protein
MNFKQKLAASVLLPLTLFLLALLVSIWGQIRIEDRFASYLKSEAAAAKQLHAMYAQGLQMGQALRNIALNPADQQGRNNLEAAQKAYTSAYELAVSAAGDEPWAAELKKLPALRAAHAAIQDKVLAMIAANDPQALTALKTLETPAWRALRQAMLDQIKAVDQFAEVQLQDNTRQAATLRNVSLGLMAFAALVAVVTMVHLMKVLKAELGGDPTQARQALAAIAKGDLTYHLPDLTADTSQSLMGELHCMQTGLITLVQHVQEASQHIEKACDEVAMGHHNLSARTESAASNLEETAASMEQITSTVQQSADAARQADQLAKEAATLAVRGGEVVGRVVGTMDAISDSSRRIADIIGVIDGIAFQTNILALNAAVEAARAGEQGRGFAVVAGEVRSLAQRSAGAAKEIKDLISTSVQTVTSGNELVRSAGHTMDELVASVQRVANMLSEITSATSEESSGITEVNSAVTLLDQMTQQNAALVEAGAATTDSLRQQAQRLSLAVSAFKLA